MWRIAQALEAGIVGVNAAVVSTAVAPFGGIGAALDRAVPDGVRVWQAGTSL
ncbi:MAG TPA: hypothetical protein VGO48_10980 [Conexibacter sp.]|jgi:acyl-CoA reductase-like NAD-dependent aldehyde dehydrogenase|nr:hypothetical protein [Conexibacter sp.]